MSCNTEEENHVLKWSRLKNHWSHESIWLIKMPWNVSLVTMFCSEKYSKTLMWYYTPLHSAKTTQTFGLCYMVHLLPHFTLFRLSAKPVIPNMHSTGKWLEINSQSLCLSKLDNSPLIPAFSPYPPHSCLGDLDLSGKKKQSRHLQNWRNCWTPHV